MKEAINVGYYRLVTPSANDKAEVNRIVAEFTGRFEKAIDEALQSKKL
jgi:hypothetical protein